MTYLMIWLRRRNVQSFRETCIKETDSKKTHTVESLKAYSLWVFLYKLIILIWSQRIAGFYT